MNDTYTCAMCGGVFGKASEVLDVYADQSQIATSPFDLTLYLLKRAGTPNSTQPPIQVGCVRMSLEHAKVLAIMLKKSVKMHEESQGQPIKLHPQAMQSAGLSEAEDW